MSTSKKLPVLKRLKCFGEEDHIEVVVNGKTYQMNMEESIRTVDSLREANEAHLSKGVLKLRREKEAEEAGLPYKTRASVPRGTYKK
jgi:hypothetical protein